MADKAIKLKCEATIGGESRYITAFTADIGIDDYWPSVTLESHKKKNAESSAIKASAKDVPKYIGKIQNKIFKARSSPDVQIKIKITGDTSGGGGTFKFKGFLTGAQYSISTGNLACTTTAVPDYATVSSLNYAIYGPMAATEYGESSEPDLEDCGTIPQFILKCMQILEQSYLQDPNATKRITDFYKKKQHQINQKLKTNVQKLLSGSDTDEFFGWTQEIASLLKEPSPSTLLRARVMGLLLASGGSFETTLAQIAEEFQEVYVPEWTSIGKFKSRGNLLKNKESLPLTIVSISVNTANGNGSLFPINYVAVDIPTTTEMYEDSYADFVVEPISNVNKGSSMLRTTGPLWYPAPAGGTQEIPKEGKKPKNRKKKVSVKKAKQVAKKKRKKQKDNASPAEKLWKRWAKNEYVFQALSGSRASITTTVNFKVKVGKCYQVMNKKDGSQLFTGVLSHIHHSINTGLGTNPSASTTLDFFIVQCSGFQLPGAPK